MKSPISPHQWEDNKAFICRLYMEDDWPLKHVIRRIRSADFNPTESQLRSKLKKWRIRKPSRQAKRKINDTSNNCEGTRRRHSAQMLLPENVHYNFSEPNTNRFPEERRWSSSMVPLVGPDLLGEHFLASARNPDTSRSPSLNPHTFLANGTPILNPTVPWYCDGYPSDCYPALGSHLPSCGSTTPAALWSTHPVSEAYGPDQAYWYSLSMAGVYPSLGPHPTTTGTPSHSHIPLGHSQPPH